MTTVIRKTYKPQVDIVDNQFYAPPDVNYGMTVGDSINPQTVALQQSPAVYGSSQAVITPEVINTTSPRNTPTTVGEQLGWGRGMSQAFKQGGTKGAMQYGLNRAAGNVGEAVGTTKANFKAQSFGEKFNTVGSTISDIMNAINTRKQLKLTRQALGHQTAMDNKNYDMARKQWNESLEDKARYREAMARDQGRSYGTVGEVMAKYGA